MYTLVLHKYTSLSSRCGDVRMNGPLALRANGVDGWTEYLVYRFVLGHAAEATTVYTRRIGTPLIHADIWALGVD